MKYWTGYLTAAILGGISWVLLQFGLYEPIAIFVGAFLGSILGQYCARRMQMIASIFVLLSMIPLVPGLGLYRCMRFLAQEMYSAGADAGVRAMVDIVMIALGLAMGSFIFRMAVLARPRKEALK